MKKQVTIKQKQFKDIKENPSLLGFGCMRFPTESEESQTIDEVRAEKMIDFAYEHGVNYFDTAYPYHNEQSEPFIGKVLAKYPRESFYLATKMPGWKIESADDAKMIFNEQLRRCRVEYFDFYLCHALSEKNIEPYKLDGVMPFLKRMKEEGKIRHLGFSFHDTPEMLEKIVAMFDWDFCLLQINYLDWSFQDAKRQYEIAKKNDLPVMVMEPVRGGALAQLNEEARKILKRAAPDESIASWAFRYAASLEQVMVILSGMSDEKQITDNIKTLSDFKPLGHKEQEALQKALNVFMESNTVPCTKCDYCMPCPEGVDIPGVFTIYNEYRIDKRDNFFVHRYEQLGEAKDASNCTACGACLEKCPQKIDIPARMDEIAGCYHELKGKA